MINHPLSGAVTFLFNNVEGNTRLWGHHPEAMKTTLDMNGSVFTLGCHGKNGYVIKTTGDGVRAGFETAVNGITALVIAQQALYAQPWDEIKPLSLLVRMGLQTTESDLLAS